MNNGGPVAAGVLAVGLTAGYFFYLKNRGSRVVAAKKQEEPKSRALVPMPSKSSGQPRVSGPLL